MKARDVLAEIDGDDLYAGFLHETDQAVIVDALLATTPEGEGVYIAPDGTLMRVAHRVIGGIEGGDDA